MFNRNINARVSRRLYLMRYGKQLIGICIVLTAFISGGHSKELTKQEIIKELQMTLIPPSEFIMGTGGENDNPNQKPEHPVFLNAYRIAMYEVTNEQYRAFFMDGGYRKEELWTSDGWRFVQENEVGYPSGWTVRGFEDLRKPVIGVSWYEANAFANWLGMRLPTEAEWEKAAKGTDGRLYPWGNEFDNTKVFYKAITRPLEVGSFPTGASPYGILDMAGNIWEWVADWYDRNYYNKSPTIMPKGPNSGKSKVVRGGGWGCNRRQMQCAYRRHEKPTWRRLDIGFRVAQDAK